MDDRIVKDAARWRFKREFKAVTSCDFVMKKWCCEWTDQNRDYFAGWVSTEDKAIDAAIEAQAAKAAIANTQS